MAAHEPCIRRRPNWALAAHADKASFRGFIVNAGASIFSSV